MNAIELKNISKKYKLFHNQESNLKYIFLNMLKGKRSRFHSDFWALKDINLQIKKGETVGFVGRNGSGKSTILKLISKILYPNEGTINAKGKISTLIELGSGFHPDLTGRENVYINASILGFSRSEVNKKFPEIVKFSGLEEFIDNPVKTYSSGMYVRLGFSVAINIEPDILLVDEVLAVGDETFQKKCIKKIFEFKKKGKTIVFVSHDLQAVEQLCDKVYLVHNGQLVKEGTAVETIAEYHKLLIGTSQLQLRQSEIPENRQADQSNNRNRWGSKEAEITGVSFLSNGQEEVQFVRTGETFRFRIHYKANTKINNPVFGMAIYNDRGIHITGPNTKKHNFKINYIDGKGYVEYQVEKFLLLPGTYLFSAAIYDYDGLVAYDHWEQYWRFHVIESPDFPERGIIAIPSQWSIQHEE